MILDERTEFADAVLLPTGSQADTRSLMGDVIDLGSAGVNPNDNGRLAVVLSVDTSAAYTGSPTVTFEVASDAQAAIATDGTATVHYVTGPLAASDLEAGDKIVMPLPPATNYERYLGVLIHVIGSVGNTVDAGKVNLNVTMDAGAAWKAYPDAVN